MEADESISEDEVFVGEITEREMNHPSFNSRRRTTVYFPGISRPDANISVHRETTKDGTLLFSFENMEESGSEGNTVNRCEQMSEGLALKSGTETGKLSERDGNRWLSSQVHLSHESDMDSGFSSVSGGSSVSTIISSSSLTSEELDFLPNTEVKQKITQEAYRCDISSETDTVYLQSPRQSVKPQADSLDLGASAINRDANCSEAFSMGSTVSATTNAAAAAVTQTAVHTGTGAFSELTVTPLKCDQSSAPAISGVVKDFPTCHSVRGFMSPTAKTYHRTLPLKRKIARKSPSLELETDCSDTNGFRVQQGKCSPVSTFSNYGDTSDYYSFDIFHASRKLQKLDLGCDQSPETEHSKTLSTLDRKMFAGGDADVTPKQSSTAPRVLAQETPILKMTAITDSLYGNPPSSEGFVQTNHNDESEIIPSPQGTGNDFSPNMCREVGAVTAEAKGSKSRIDSSRTAPLTPLSANKHSTNMDQSSTLSPDLFCSPCLEKSTLPVTSTQGPILSPRPGSASTCINSPKPPLQPLQPVQEEKGPGRSSKYGRLPLRKPMKTKRENKENTEEGPVSGLSWSSFSFSFVQTDSLHEGPLSAEEESRAAMTHINTVINGEIRHVLKDFQSSPSLLTHFPPPREATRVSWSENLAEEAVVSLSPTRTPVAPRSILQKEKIASWTQEADNGSEDDQLRLGAHLLSLADSDVDREVNAGKAIQWLILASRQGNDEATKLLDKCTKTGTGITDQNAAEVNWCINTSTSEKKIRHAARSLFHRINKTHKDVISKDEYMEAISGLTDSVRQQKLLAAAGKKIGDEINENDFVKMLSKKIQGKVTLTSGELDEASASYKSAGIVTKVFVYPRQTASVVMEQGLEWASKEGLNFVMSMVPTNQIYILAMLFAYSFLTPAFIFFLVPLFVFYLSIITLLVATLQMFYKKKKQKDATDLAVVLQKFDVNISMDDTQSQYSWNSLTPYFVFFSTLPLAVVSFALANKAYIPCSEMFVMAGFMAGFCFIGLSDEHDKLTFFLLLAHTIASLPVFLHNFPDVPLIATLVRFLTEPFFALDFGVGLQFNISIPSLFYIIMPLFFVRMGMKKSWAGLHRIVIPHLVCYFWYHIMTAFFPYSTWKGLARATVGYLFLPILVPLSFLLAVGLLIYIGYKLVQTQLFGKILVTLLLLAVPLLLTQTKALFGGKVDKKLGRTKKIVMIVFAVMAVLPLIFIQVPQLTESKALELPWEEYKFMCIPGEGENVPSFQIRCGTFAGTRVSWTGKLAWSKVTKIENTAESVLRSLPSFVSKPLYCIYGEAFPECDESTMSAKTFRNCQLMQSTGRTCEVKNHNVYSFQLGVIVDGVSITLEAGNGFHAKVMAMETGDEVEFTGSLLDGLGTAGPRLKLSTIKVQNRELPEMLGMEQDEDEQFYFRALHDGVRLSINFFFFPIFEYTGIY